MGHRACLTDSLHYRSTDLDLSCHVHKERVAAERVAQLSVWLNQGWDKTLVEACDNWFSEELQTQVYAVPVRELSWKEEFAKIEEQILQHERELRKKEEVFEEEEGCH